MRAVPGPAGGSGDRRAEESESSRLENRLRAGLEVHRRRLGHASCGGYRPLRDRFASCSGTPRDFTVPLTVSHPPWSLRVVCRGARGWGRGRARDHWRVDPPPPRPEPITWNDAP